MASSFLRFYWGGDCPECDFHISAPLQSQALTRDQSMGGKVGQKEWDRLWGVGISFLGYIILIITGLFGHANPHNPVWIKHGLKET